MTSNSQNTTSSQNTPTFPVWSLKHQLIPLLKRPRVAQAIKWSVYSLLLVNFGIYALDDWQVFHASLAEGADLGKVVETFSTTIDMAAWVGLIILLELETYILPDEAFEGWTIKVIKALRGIFYIMVIYAAYGYTANTLDNYKVVPIPEVTKLCNVANDERYLQINIVDFVEITPTNCLALSNADTFYKIDENVSLIDPDVLEHVQSMGWVDVINAITWIVLVLLIEFEVFLQNADKFRSRALAIVRGIKTPLYGVLFINAGIWLATAYPIYTWDALLWIIGFWAIELNLAEWESERVIELASLSEKTAQLRGND